MIRRSQESWKMRLDGEYEEADTSMRMDAALSGFTARDALLSMTQDGQMYIQAWDAYAESQGQVWPKLDFATGRTKAKPQANTK